MKKNKTKAYRYLPKNVPDRRITSRNLEPHFYKATTEQREALFNYRCEVSQSVINRAQLHYAAMFKAGLEIPEHSLSLQAYIHVKETGI